MSSPDGSSKHGRSYDLHERRRTGNMTGNALYQHMPTDESEAKTLATVDLDGIKSEYVCVFCVRHHVSLHRYIIWNSIWYETRYVWNAYSVFYGV